MQRGATTTHVRDEYQRLTTGSRALWQRALGSLPGGNTRTTIFHDPYPVYLERGEGCRVWDVDGVERIDFISNYTSLILGHCHPRVVEAVQSQASRMMSGAAPTELEIELAEQISERLPSVEQIRFANSGTEATMLALADGARVHRPREGRRVRPCVPRLPRLRRERAGRCLAGAGRAWHSRGCRGDAGRRPVRRHRGDVRRSSLT